MQLYICYSPIIIFFHKTCFKNTNLPRGSNTSIFEGMSQCSVFFQICPLYIKVYVQIHHIHHAEFIGAVDAPDGQYGKRVALDFIVYFDKNKDPVKIGKIFGKKLTPKSKLWEALTLLGGNLEVGKEFDTKSILGNFCRVVVEDYKNKMEKIVSGVSKIKSLDGNTESFIKKNKRYLDGNHSEGNRHDITPANN